MIDADGEVRELSAEDMAKFRPAADVLPASLVDKTLEAMVAVIREGQVNNCAPFDASGAVVALGGVMTDSPAWQRGLIVAPAPS